AFLQSASFQTRRTWHRKQRKSAVLTARNQVPQFRKEKRYCIQRKGEPGYENRFRNCPIFGGRDLSRYGAERLPELHSSSPAGGYCGTVPGRPLCLALPVGDLRVSGHRRCTSTGQPLRTVGGGRAGAGYRQHYFFPRFDGPERASAGSLRGCTVGGDFRRRATGVYRVVPVARGSIKQRIEGFDESPR